MRHFFFFIIHEVLPKMCLFLRAHYENMPMQYNAIFHSCKIDLIFR